MTGLLIFLLIIVILFCYILFAPFYMELNTVNGKLTIKFHRIISADFFITESSLLMNLNVAGWRKKIDLFQKKEQKKKIVKKKVKQASGKQVISFKKLSAIIKSFKVNKFYLSLSFDDMLLNGIAYPLFIYFNTNADKKIEINFINENEIILEVENNFYRIIRAYTKS
jgi:hypothetical protein